MIILFAIYLIFVDYILLKNVGEIQFLKLYKFSKNKELI